MAEIALSWRNAAVAHVTLKRGAAAPFLWPAPNRAVQTGALMLASIAPDAALAIGDPAPDWPSQARAAIGGDAIVVDQSGAYRILRLDGAAARDLLAAGIFIDLDADAFPAGAAAALRCGHIAIVLLRTAETSFDMLVPRSSAESFLHWLKTSAAMRGLAFPA